MWTDERMRGTSISTWVLCSSHMPLPEIFRSESCTSIETIRLKICWSCSLYHIVYRAVFWNSIKGAKCCPSWPIICFYFHSKAVEPGHMFSKLQPFSYIVAKREHACPLLINHHWIVPWSEYTFSDRSRHWWSQITCYRFQIQCKSHGFRKCPYTRQFTNFRQERRTVSLL